MPGFELIGDEERAAVNELFDDGGILFRHGWDAQRKGRYRVLEFERAFAEYCGVKHGVGLDNGTNALFLALKAFGIPPGSEVITVPNTAVATVAAIVAAGASPRFVDIDPASYLMNVQLLEDAITPRTACIAPVHLFGQCVPMSHVRRIATRHDIRVLEDASQSHGATVDGQKCGSMSDIAAFSLYPTKPLGAYGDAGIALTNGDELNARLRRLRFYGMEGVAAGQGGSATLVYSALENGHNSRLDEVQAAILLVKLRALDRDIARRREIAARYEQALKGTSLVLPRTLPAHTHAFYLYVCRHPDRDRILSEMAARDIWLNVSYPSPLHLMPAYRNLGYAQGDFPQAELAAREIFSLPMYPSLTEAQQESVCRALGQVLAEAVYV